MTVQYAGYPVNTLITPIHESQESFRVTNEVHINIGDVMVISNCQHAEIFQIKSVAHNQGIQIVESVKPLEYEYDANSEVSRLEVNRYYVAKTKRNKSNGNPLYSLF